MYCIILLPTVAITINNKIPSEIKNKKQGIVNYLVKQNQNNVRVCYVNLLTRFLTFWFWEIFVPRMMRKHIHIHIKFIRESENGRQTDNQSLASKGQTKNSLLAKFHFKNAGNF